LEIIGNLKILWFGNIGNAQSLADDIAVYKELCSAEAVPADALVGVSAIRNKKWENKNCQDAGYITESISWL
jgi:hypothetical protein